MQPVSQVMGWDDYRGAEPSVGAVGSVTTGVQGDVVDCRLSEWSRWGPCDATCGVGYKIKQRTILVRPPAQLRIRMNQWT